MGHQTREKILLSMFLILFCIISYKFVAIISLYTIGHILINALKISKLPLIQNAILSWDPERLSKNVQSVPEIIQVITTEQRQEPEHRARTKRSDLQRHSNWLRSWSLLAW